MRIEIDQCDLTDRINSIKLESERFHDQQNLERLWEAVCDPEIEIVFEYQDGTKYRLRSVRIVPDED